MAAKGTASSERKLRVVADNRKARFNYFIDETFEARLALTSTKPNRYARANRRILCRCLQANRFNHAPKRPRKLLLHLRQINKLVGAVARE
jgi:SsrA-binding protein